MADKRLIKKYPNRRLYDTAISSYVTLEDVKALVLDGVDFEVTDAKTGTDLTRTILLQIISDQEEGGEPIFSSDLLAQIIRAYGGNMQSLLTSYLEKSMDLWADQQQALRERARTFMDASNPVQVLSQITDQNLSMWRQAMDRFRYDQNDSSSGKGSADGETGSESSSKGDDKPGDGKQGSGKR
ncbi:polyhydroxyalkanoate synthesis repressor PhaR [Spiribacter vilamensis]|uniref:Polyhydroxyalkanoate synthesis repressor PhaR n=1 Tax=Spiribacter vilamensis TaxID=531306 RepID=A0A4Q8D138_9GAMM|nr:polyhydroxyalkanoate synthesis repressor PhaR [Spiribacter vilamensis]RZU99059.1 polyhydroxyalkanoate synthesis repressor PhaR [Spiribacter vilamensis]TVO61942.1 polyhydroxyalkanoate synthesis repressor PhaR [Spiribacter vilamensis]